MLSLVEHEKSFMTLGPGPTMFAVTSASFGCITVFQNQTIAVWPIRVQMEVFFCSSVSAVLLKPQGPPGVSTSCNCQVLILASSQSFH